MVRNLVKENAKQKKYIFVAPTPLQPFPDLVLKKSKLAFG
jgi:hypothetical protein